MIPTLLTRYEAAQLVRVPEEAISAYVRKQATK
jgi:hypothetical protein